MSLETWLTVFIIGFVVVVSPGPNFAVTIRNSLVYSRRAGLCTVLGMALGSLVHITYCLVGIGVIIAKSILLFEVLKWLGAIYLVYIGIRSLLAGKRPSQIEDFLKNEPINNYRAFYTGLLTDLLNPKATLFFLALFTQLIDPQTTLLAQLVYGFTMDRHRDILVLSGIGSGHSPFDSNPLLIHLAPGGALHRPGIDSTGHPPGVRQQ